ncbi:MAG: hypothetical protein A2Y82_00175 [Candidatus Buchananbacteria bacterium RBG_13_36_9]|uniref:bAvd-like domain-containing protein n=1 Tax=Candidatus Buchananbacteria bacterium RBG_13_36_9 TaxID=1797530 RepID=A0A1G1XP82_9BACT|nr:MAG: hypothetical protein A2Y82_00175 [Candidatus Buchananbacteria bacterium RBG_13_36_9]
MNFHNSLTSADETPIIIKFNESYKLWHGFLIHIPRLTRYTLGAKIDNIFTECLELSLLAGYSARETKLPLVQKLSVKFDALKFFLKLLWELKALDNKKYAALSQPLSEIGKMIGGWLNLLKKENSSRTAGRE